MSDLPKTNARWLTDQQPDDDLTRLLTLLFGEEPATTGHERQAPQRVLHGAA